MKKVPYIYNTLMALQMLVFISMLSCSTEDTLVEEGQGVVQVSLNGSQLRAGSLYANEDLIEKVRVLVFKDDGTIEKNELFTSGDAAFVNPFRVSISTGTKDVYIVANETSGLTPQLVAVNSLTNFESLLAQPITTVLNLPLLMVGEILSVDIVAKQLYAEDITLKRVAAKIKLQFKKDTSADVRITGVKLLKNTGKTVLVEGGTTISGQNYWDYSFPLGLNLTLTTDYQFISGSETVYVYENLTGGNNENATRLEVDALYNGIQTKYRVFINENVSSPVNSGDPNSSVVDLSDHLYSIKRNYSYVLSGTIQNMGEFDGFSLETNVLPWEKIESEVLYDWVFVMDPRPATANKTYIVNSMSDEITFSFKLTNPLEASWTANLTNPTDFEIINYQGTIDQEVIIKVKARNDQSSSERRTELYINAQYGGNSAEIPLLSGSTLIGTGNRIVIRQPAN